MKIEIPDEIMAALSEVATTVEHDSFNAPYRDAAALAAGMLAEAIKMRRVPGILFADGATGRRARIGGTGIEVFEVIEAYESAGRNEEELRMAFHWLENHQLTAALAYYAAYPEDIAPRLKSDEQAQAELEALWSKYPQTSPHWPGRQRKVSTAGTAVAHESA